MLWRDEEGTSSLSTSPAARAQRGGWGLSPCGPTAGRGIGKTIVRTALDWLLEQEVATLGLETMPRTVENIGFYARLGFFPGHLTVTLTNDIVDARASAPVLLSQRKGRSGRPGARGGARARRRARAGYDFTREILLTAELGLAIRRSSTATTGWMPWCCGTRHRSRGPAEGRGARAQGSPPVTRAPSTPRSWRRKPPRPAPGSGASPCDARPASTTRSAGSWRAGYRVR